MARKHNLETMDRILNPPPKPNLYLKMGEGFGSVTIGLIAPRTRINRFKYWMLTKFFPFTIEDWAP